MNMNRISRKHFLHFLLLILFDIGCSHNNDTSTENHRHGRVSGRIVKLYSGPKPDPILCVSEGFLADTVDCSVFYRCSRAPNGKYTVYRFQCGPGTVYDPETEVCNHPRSTKRYECGGLNSNKVMTSTDKYIENEIDGLHKVNHEVPSPISTKPPKVSNSFVNPISTLKPVEVESSYATTSYPFSSSSKVIDVETISTSTTSPWNIPLSVSTKKPWHHTPTQATYYITRQPSIHGGVKCTSDGFIGDNEDCRKFYRCVNNQRGGYIKYEFSCSESTIWDDDTQGCNHPWAVQRRRCGKGSSYNENSVNYIDQIKNNDITSDYFKQEPTQFPYGYKITQLQTQTSTKPTIQNQSQIHFGDRLNTGNLNVQNQPQISYDSANTQNQFIYGNQVTHAYLHTNQNKSSQNILMGAAMDGTTMERTTNKYYTTVSSSPYNNEIGYVSQTNQQGHEWPKSSTQTTLLNTAIMETKLNEIDCRSSGFFGNKHDCAKFYRCVENGDGRFTKYEYKCGDGTVWDTEIESCNHAWLVKSCSGNSSNSNHEENIVTSSNTHSAIITTVSLVQTTTQKNILDEDYNIGYQPIHRETSLPPIITTELISSLGNECRTSGFMGDNDCKKFYRCVENGNGGFTRYEFTCGEGTVWDPNIKSCNHAWAVDKCGVHTITDTPVTGSTSQSQGDFHNNDIYNTNQENSNGPEHTVTTTPPKPTTNLVTPVNNETNNCQQNGFMGDKYDCKIFYRCVENGNGGFIRYEFSCGDGTVWDSKISACNHEWAVENCGSSTPAHEYVSSSTEPPNVSLTSIGNEISTHHTTLSGSTTILTSTISTVNNNQCVSSGFIGDKQDCKKFYRCVEDEKGHYIRYEFSCGDGTLWDPKIQACNHAWAVKSCENNNYSDYDSASTSRSTTMRDEDNMPTTQIKQEITSTTENNAWSSSTTTLSNKIDDEECTTEGFMGDNYDCKRFYRCVDDGKGTFIRYEFTCGDGTVWDSEINACNHVNSVKTPCSSLPTQTTKENDSTYSVSSSPTEVNYNSTTTKEPPMSQRCEKEGFFGDKSDCKKFYRCTENGQEGFHKYEFTCGDGTIWDQEILACNHPSSNSLCGLTDNESQENNTGDQSTTTSIGTSQSTERTQTLSSTDECISDGFYANTNDCKKFFRCVGDGRGGFIRYDFTCGEGTIWVQDIQACDHETDTSFCNKGIVATTTTPAYAIEGKPVSISTTTTRSSTTDKSSPAPSANPTMHDETVSGSSSTSETSSSISTSTSSPMQDNCEEAGYFGNTKDCKMFYRCVDNGKGGYTKYDFTCGDGTIWDQDITACNHPQDVSNPSCDSVGSTSTTTTTTITTTTTKATSVSSSEPTKTTSSSESTTTESGHQSTQKVSTKKPNGNNNYTCPEAGFYADPYDCKKFYRCVDWAGDGKTFSIYHFDCGEGTIWDPNLQTCNHEESVYPPRDCSGTQSQTENNNETTTTAKQEETTESGSTEGSTQPTTQKTTTQSSTTTESSSTTDQTSTQQSSSSEQTTSSQQSSTQKSTTTQQSTTDQSSTQQSTTEQSTTQKTNPTQQSTTSEQTTSTTTEQTTSTTTEQTTSTTTEQSTSTTTEQTTSTTTEQTTTTANEETPATTAQTSTTESTTTTVIDQTTKAEQTTTQESNTENQSSTTEQSTTQDTSDGSTSATTENGQETTTQQQSSDKECPQTDDDQYVFVCPTGFRRHPKYCNLFYQCTEDDDSHEMKVAVFNCPNNTIYDESKTQCIEEEKADKKCDGEMAQRHRVKRLDANYKEPITVGKDKYLCAAVGHFPFEKNEQCSPVLFKCELTKSGKLRGLIYQCPDRYVYWSISRRCEPISTMTECKRSLSNWKNRYEIPIEKNNVARTIK